MYKIFTDSDSDITPEKAAEYGYTLISMPYTLNNKDVYPYQDGQPVDFKGFYDTLRKGALPSTSALSPQKYTEYFEPVFAEGYDILYVSFSSAMTATFGFMEKALEELAVRYPERKLFRIDTKAITIGSYAIAEEIGEFYKQGKTIEEILDWAKTEVDKFAVYFFADDLKFFGRSGRVSGITATMGNLFGVRPIIYMNAEGKMVSIGKERGRAKALARLIDYTSELGEDIKAHNIIIGHTDIPDTAIEVREMLRARHGNDINVEIVNVNPTAGSHCGPNALGICFHAKHR